MALDLIIYTRDTNESLIEKIEKRFSDFGMNLKFHPDFKFDEESDTGFCPFRLEILNHQSGHYADFNKPLLTGFEIYFDSYEYPEVSIKDQKKSFFSNLFRSKNKPQQPIEYVVNEQIDAHLKNCNEQITISWQTGPELRVSLFFATFLAELTNGIILDPRCDDYFLPERAIDVFPDEILDYERSFSKEEFSSKLHEFKDWV
ncbi:hypothetical protein AB9P05_21390 [Roseivirga sp. BDSF3-8]|uniref:hypothetical protein n=1 Tax=Roseivirga sp. BDSF3-8 TaxID=3241598 RepID=UPI003531C4BF